MSSQEPDPLEPLDYQTPSPPPRKSQWGHGIPAWPVLLRLSYFVVVIVGLAIVLRYFWRYIQMINSLSK
jgi:hypothetical protein